MEELEYLFDEVDFCECIGEFEDEYVYDIEMQDDTHTFIADDILVHNSLYLSYDPLIKSIKGHENMSIEQKRDIIVGINLKFLDDHNCQYIKEYYDTRFGQSAHKFELETLSLSGLWLDVKKRYAQLLLWKEGENYDLDKLKLKVKGLELIKSSYPKAAREGLNRVVKYILENANVDNIIHKINIKVQEEKQKFQTANIEDICGNQKVNGYTKYVISDDGDMPVFANKTPAGIKAVAQYNWLRNKYNLPGDPIYSGKVKIYTVKSNNKKGEELSFAFLSQRYPKWANQYAPIDRTKMFEKMFLDPLNRIVQGSMGLPALSADGYIQIDLFGF